MSSSSYSDFPNRNRKNGFQLLEQTFSSYVQAFDWCKSNRYKYKHCSKNNVDELMKIKILKYYIYRCDCHGANCPNERKLAFHSTGQGTFEILMFERGLHSSSSCVPKMRGIDTRLLEFIDYLCRQGKPSKEIRCAVLQKAKAGQWGTIEDIVIPSEKQIFNRKTSVMKSLSRIATTEQFQASSSSITSLLEQTAKKDDDYVLSSDGLTPPFLASTFTNPSSSAACNKDTSRIATTEQFQASSSSTTSPPESTATTDDDYVWSSEGFTPPFLASTFSNPSSSAASQDSSSSIISIPEPKFTTKDDEYIWSSDELNTSPDSTLAFLSSYAIATPDEARHNNTSKEQMKTQFDFNSIKEGFLAYNSTQRFEMILQLQMLNDFKSLNEQPHQIRLEEKPPAPKKQKLSNNYIYSNTCIYDDDDEEEVIYRDP